ncbi:MAG: hypothetical protein EAZ95_06300 [Bacteroidetes bacterium]|nr:MAG: hypothetical protein EAZ95_06300 [Bacteroidota bacterium]
MSDNIETPSSEDANKPKDDTPTETPKGDTPTETPKGDTPAETPKGDTPTETPKGDTPTETPKDNTPAETPKDNTPAETPKGNTPTETPKDNTPAETPKDNTPAETPKDNTPAETPKDNTPAETPKDNTPAETPNDNTPAETPKGNVETYTILMPVIHEHEAVFILTFTITKDIESSYIESVLVVFDINKRNPRLRMAPSSPQPFAFQGNICVVPKFTIAGYSLSGTITIPVDSLHGSGQFDNNNKNFIFEIDVFQNNNMIASVRGLFELTKM